MSYSEKIQQEIEYYKEVANVHDLPPIFHYWSHNYLLPRLNSLGFSNLQNFYISYIEQVAVQDPTSTCTILSLGAGNCDTEIALALALLKKNITNFTFTCIDINHHMLERAKQLILEYHLLSQFDFIETDINSWEVNEKYQIIIANQSLHHFVNLEILFDKIYVALDDLGFFLSHDMIGRNGHMYWPEALEILLPLWSVLEDRHKWNHLLNRFEFIYENWDCSVEGFEGIRSQDILPLLLKKFKFDSFLGFANLINVFIDRCFGHNFKVDNPHDCYFIDFVARLDNYYIEIGKIKPTQMIAAMTKVSVSRTKIYKHLTPEFCVRLPDVTSNGLCTNNNFLERPKIVGVCPFPEGHFYSPIVNIEDVKKSRDKIWMSKPEVLGIDFNDLSHKTLLSEVFPKYLANYDYPSEKQDKAIYHTNNPQFGWLDSRVLFAMLRYLSPQRMIEVGSGYSSLLIADVNCRFLKSQLEFICIEPYPPSFLLEDILFQGISCLIQEKVEDLPVSTFANLKSGDVLFIDSSHVSKTGSDVNYLYFEILPRLSEGVFIHIHDIFLPRDYPEQWIIEERRSWNEQYLVRALLTYSYNFDIVFSCSYAAFKYPELVRHLLRGELYSGGSLWLRKKY
ncbi:class I SAM-dependent methyltransferase [Pseudanabaena sp. PCC 6802]|uniref:class I SAM-dependent methyltransferase n=1 Tax=Pseudanabaena sp. PCC 6802 TaxID=118173 RepID=UPI00034C0DA3|nr:methyltransferase domain-containing protein [Pseudanabaena sp. PCC 6802]